MASIPAGVAVIGTDDPEASEEELPQWMTELEAFLIDRYEVTNYQYGLCVRAGTCDPPHDPAYFDNPASQDLPVVGVTAYQADTYCRWLGKRLPTELEWERAARGPDGKDWPWGNDSPSPQYANLAFDDAVDSLLLPAHSFQKVPSAEGIYNLVGNVWEWTSSYLQSYAEYDSALYWDSSHGPPQFDGLVQRGGSWDDNTLLRVTRRVSVLAADDEQSVGIRCAKGP
jgi:formylglycine-generating enzyme required for sulfatase activity